MLKKYQKSDVKFIGNSSKNHWKKGGKIMKKTLKNRSRKKMRKWWSHCQRLKQTCNRRFVAFSLIPALLFYFLSEQIVTDTQIVSHSNRYLDKKIYNLFPSVLLIRKKLVLSSFHGCISRIRVDTLLFRLLSFAHCCGLPSQSWTGKGGKRWGSTSTTEWKLASFITWCCPPPSPKSKAF